MVNSALGDFDHSDRSAIEGQPLIVDHPTQLICTSDIYHQQTNANDIAGQSAGLSLDMRLLALNFFAPKQMQTLCWSVLAGIASIF